MNKSKTNTGKAISRGRFLHILGGAGLLTFLGSIPAFAAKLSNKPLAAKQPSGEQKMAKVNLNKMVRSPLIKGKSLSQKALTSKLATQNLENIRDVLTGRLFGNAAEDAFKNGKTPFINWDLGDKGGASGCFYYAFVANEGEMAPVDNCGVFLMGRDLGGGQVAIDIAITPGAGRLFGLLSSKMSAEVLPCSGKCNQCQNYCASVCDLVCQTHCEAVCKPNSSLDLGDIVSYPGDAFASELSQILETTDVGKIQSELKNIIFSDEVLNLGLGMLAAGAFNGISEQFAM